MIDDILAQGDAQMAKALVALENAFNRIRTGRANPNLLDPVKINYYGAPTPLSQVANIMVEDGRTLAISPWESNLVPEIEKAILKSDLGLNPNTSGGTIRISMPMLTEETRKDFIKQARAEAEKARVSVRNGRRDANSEVKELLKEKMISEDEARSAEDLVQKLTDKFVAKVDDMLANKEADLLKV